MTIDDIIQNLKHGQNQYNKLIKAQAEESELVKNGEISLEDELNNSGYVLYNQIMENTITMFESDQFKEIFRQLVNSAGEETSTIIMSLLSTVMNVSSYQAILFYDSLLKDELRKQSDHVAEHINTLKAEIIAQRGALKVFKEKIDKLYAAKTIDELKSSL